MSTERMREEFEEWARRVLEMPMRRNASGDYKSFVVSMSWKAWQASRTAVSVELPLIHRDNYATAWGYNCAIEAVCMTAERIQAAGLQVKP